MVGREWISTMDENHRQYEFSSYWGVNAERGFPSYDSHSESYNPAWQNHFNYWDQEEQLRYQPPPSPMQVAPQTPNSGVSDTLSHIIFQGLVKEQNVLKLDGREVLRNCKEKTRRFYDFVILKKLFEVGKKVLFYKVRLKLISGKLSSSWLGRFEAVNVFPHGVARIKSLATRQIFKVKGHRSKPFLGGDEVTTIIDKALAPLQQLTH
ncbi:UNVERIFIED_CONTAM: hypothetical protein Sradi_0002000 [Sesamum radiatum]|uniref:Reverse transcriptase domain-containing protein n=1 Tax=Sesamum radiatum TaxID=300843 RepID=A0AAW2WHB9_SESRA